MERYTRRSAEEGGVGRGADAAEGVPTVRVTQGGKIRALVQVGVRALLQPCPPLSRPAHHRPCLPTPARPRLHPHTSRGTMPVRRWVSAVHGRARAVPMAVAGAVCRGGQGNPKGRELRRDHKECCGGAAAACGAPWVASPAAAGAAPAHRDRHCEGVRRRVTLQLSGAQDTRD